MEDHSEAVSQLTCGEKRMPQCLPCLWELPGGIQTWIHIYNVIPEKDLGLRQIDDIARTI